MMDVLGENEVRRRPVFELRCNYDAYINPVPALPGGRDAMGLRWLYACPRHITKAAKRIYYKKRSSCAR